MLQLPLAEISIDAVKDLINHREALENWVTATQSAFKEMEEGWDHQKLGGACADLKVLLGGIVERAQRDWNQKVRSVADALSKVLPPKGMVHNPRMLVDTNIRAAFSKAVTELYNSQLMNQASDVAILAKKAQDLAKCNLPAVKILTIGRRSAKCSVCVNWAIDQVLNFKPNQPKDLELHAENICIDMKKKGFPDVEDPKFGKVQPCGPCVISTPFFWFFSLQHRKSPSRMLAVRTISLLTRIPKSCSQCCPQPNMLLQASFRFLSPTWLIFLAARRRTFGLPKYA